MSARANFEKHLFISYAHLDNQPLTRDQQGWITRFHGSLEAMLSMRIGRKAEIWRDQKLSGTDIFSDEILSQFSRTALLVSVLTPRYIGSEWCKREVNEFCRTAEQNGGLIRENKSRIIKIIKTPVESEDPLPPIMKEVLGYPFYTFDDEQTPLELDPAYGDELAQKYNVKVAKLAWDIAQFLRKLETADPESAAPVDAAPSKRPVYLAECSYDVRDSREALETELRAHGYPVLPDRPLPREEDACVDEISRLIAQSAISIHLVGNGYGAVPDGPGHKSVVELQNEIAVGRSKTGGFPRLIWVRDGTQSAYDDQKRFLQALHADPETQFGADLITADLEAFKTVMHAALRRAEKPAPSAAQARASDEVAGNLVYLICDERDRKATIAFRKLLRDRGIDVEIPIFDGDAATIREAQQDVFSRCDAVVVYYGAANELWRRTVVRDLKKIKAYRAGKFLPDIFTYLAEPGTDDKDELILMDEPNTINGMDGLSELGVEPILRCVHPLL